MIGAEAVLPKLARHEIALGNLEFLALGVPGEVHRFEPVEQRPWNALQEVRGCDEQHLREVERNPQIVVGEAVVLGRIEHFQQRGGRISLERDAQLIDLVEQEDRVLRARLFHPLDDAARHRPDIGAPVAANVGLIAGSTQRDPHVGTAHRACDGLGDRGLADARRSDEQQRRRARGAIVLVSRSLFLGLLLPELPNREELEHLVFHVLEPVVVLFEDFGRPFEIERLL